MSVERSSSSNPKPETLTRKQEDLLRWFFNHRFRRGYLFFQEFMQSSILFQTDLVRDKGQYTVVFTYQGADYVVPYGNLGMELVEMFQKDLEDPDQKPINFRRDIIMNKDTRDMPASLRDYFGKKVETLETVYWLKPIDGRKRAIWQTTYLDQITGNPIAERWEGIMEGQRRIFPGQNVRRVK